MSQELFTYDELVGAVKQDLSELVPGPSSPELDCFVEQLCMVQAQLDESDLPGGLEAVVKWGDKTFNVDIRSTALELVAVALGGCIVGWLFPVAGAATAAGVMLGGGKALIGGVLKQLLVPKLSEYDKKDAAIMGVVTAQQWLPDGSRRGPGPTADEILAQANQALARDRKIEDVVKLLDRLDKLVAGGVLIEVPKDHPLDVRRWRLNQVVIEVT